MVVVPEWTPRTVDAPLPVLWLYGPAGVGKTTTAWELFRQLTEGGIPAGYVDIDQLGICYAAPTSDNWAPEPASDLGRHRLKIRNLDAVAANLRTAGARCLVVSGVVDAVGGVDVALLPHAALTLCRLRCEPAELRQRIAGRGRPSDRFDRELRYAEALDRNGLPGVSIDTTGRGVADVVRLVRDNLGGWPDPAGTALAGPAGLAASVDPSAPYGVPATSPGEILWLCGPTAVGKSTVGWQIYQQLSQAGVHTAFVDLEQVGFHRPGRDRDPGGHRLKAGNLAAVWETYRATGVRRVVVVGPVDRAESVRIYARALPAATLTLCRLRASRDQLAGRIMLRGRGLGATWGLPGDELVGRPAAVLDQVVDRAAAQAEALDRTALGDLHVDTDDRAAPAIADEILRRIGWLTTAAG